MSNSNRFSYKGYRSKLEYFFAQDLEELGIQFEYEKHELEYWRKEPRSFCSTCQSGDEIYSKHWYLVDFYLPDYNLFIETKGKFTSADRTKMLAVKEQHPEITFIMIFQRDNWITKRHKSRYSDWCRKNEIQYWVVQGNK